MGRIDSVTPVGTTNADGFWVSAFFTSGIENRTLTLLLVEGFSGAAGDDLDTDDDGTLDSTPWTSLVDSVGVTDGDAGDVNYLTQVVLDPTLPGAALDTPGGGSRIPNGVDTDTVADWLVNDFDGAGLPGFGLSTLDLHEARNTPGTRNSGRPDCNGNGEDDSTEIAFGAADCNRDGFLDECQPGLDSDSDSDGTLDLCDDCPEDAGKVDHGVCGCGAPDDDTDGDGTPDCFDQCPDDPAKIAPGVCGCGAPDSLDDADGDGVIDCLDNCPTTANADQADADSNGIGDACDAPPAGQPAVSCGCGAGSALLMPLMLTAMGWMRRRKPLRQTHC